MSTIVEKVQEVIKTEELKTPKSVTFQEFRKLIAEMRRLGICKKPEYTLPLRGNSGKRLSLNNWLY